MTPVSPRRGVEYILADHLPEVVAEMIMMFVELAQQDIAVGEPDNLALRPLADRACLACAGLRRCLGELYLVSPESLEEPQRQTTLLSVSVARQAMALHLLVEHGGEIGQANGNGLHRPMMISVGCIPKWRSSATWNAMASDSVICQAEAR